jgi:hypothetical protein
MRSAVCRADTIEGDAICRRCRRPTGFDVRGLNERRPAGDLGGELPRARLIAAVSALENAEKPRRLAVQRRRVVSDKWTMFARQALNGH